jgi:hypothetical protein
MDLEDGCAISQMFRPKTFSAGPSSSRHIITKKIDAYVPISVFTQGSFSVNFSERDKWTRSSSGEPRFII